MVGGGDGTWVCSYGSYREWEKAERAEQRAKEQAARGKEQERKTRERERIQAEAAARDQEAADRTAEIEKWIDQLETLLRSSLSRDPKIPYAALRRRVEVAPQDLGRLEVPEPAPVWFEFGPEPPRGLSRMLGGRQRYEIDLRAAEEAFAREQAKHGEREAKRLRQLAEVRRAHEQTVAETEREVAAHNAQVDQLAAGLQMGDRHAVSEYMEIVLRNSPYPGGFPNEHRAGYVPESSLLAVEWYLPPVEIVPEHKSFRHIKTRKVVEPTARPLGVKGSWVQIPPSRQESPAQRPFLHHGGPAS